jgi:hypothetical protein
MYAKAVMADVANFILMRASGICRGEVWFFLSQTSEHLCSKRLNECKVKNEMLTEREKNVNSEATKCACVKKRVRMNWSGWNRTLIYCTSCTYLLTGARHVSICLVMARLSAQTAPRFMANVSWEQFEDLTRTP